MRGSLGIEASAYFPTSITNHILLYRIELIIIKHMKYRVDAYTNGAVKQGAKLMNSIDDAIVLAKKVASYYHCQTRIARVAG